MKTSEILLRVKQDIVDRSLREGWLCPLVTISLLGRLGSREASDVFREVIGTEDIVMWSDTPGLSIDKVLEKFDQGIALAVHREDYIARFNIDAVDYENTFKAWLEQFGKPKER